MSVYTSLNAAEIQSFLGDYDLPPLGQFTPIKGGIENSNYFLQLVDGRELVLTLFEELSADEAVFIGPLLNHLDSAGIPVAAPLQNRRGLYLGHLAGKPAHLAPKVVGSHPEQPDQQQCRAMGETLARLHLALKDYSLQRPNAHGAAWWNTLAERWRKKLPEDECKLLNRVLRLYTDSCTCHPDLPGGLIHGDLFRDNTLFVADTVTGVLDFSETGHDHWLLDMAIAINDFCRQWPHHAPDKMRRDAFIAGYENARPLQENERKVLPVFLIMAATRFWLSRLEIGARNCEEGRSGEHVLEKDPAEMRDLALHLLQGM